MNTKARYEIRFPGKHGIDLLDGHSYVERKKDANKSPHPFSMSLRY